MIDGFDPYNDLTKKQMLEQGGAGDSICYGLRVTLHLFMVVTTVYIVGMLITKYTIWNV